MGSLGGRLPHSRPPEPYSAPRARAAGKMGTYVTLLSQPVLRRAGARSYDFVVAIGFAHPACTSPRDPNSIPRPRNAELSPFWQLGQLPLVPAKLNVCRPRASPARRCAVLGCAGVPGLQPGAEQLTQTHCASRTPSLTAAVACASRGVKAVGRRCEVQSSELVAWSTLQLQHRA